MKQGGNHGGGLATAPLYKRLPRGPHRLPRDEIVGNQRRRMHGAMIEAVAANGYGRTSVKHVVMLAGVSRRAFYEQFDNKQECFLATLDMIAAQAMARIARGYSDAGETLEERLEASLEAFAQSVKLNPKGARLILVDAPSAGPAGWARLTKTLSAFEQRVAASFAHAPDAAPLPGPVARAIVGGLRRATFVRLVQGRGKDMPALVAPMLSWVMAFRSDEPSPLGRGLRPVAVQMRLRPEDERARLLRCALELATAEGYANLTPMLIADEADASIDVFFDFFGDVEECLLAAVARLGQEVRSLMSDPGLTGPEWPYAVRRTLGRLMCYFAARPAYTQTIATGVFAMGRRAIDMGAELAREVAVKLTEGAPCPPSTELAQEGIEGAIWHTIYRQAASGRTAALPALADYLAYVVMAPYVGAEQAGRLVADERTPQAA